MQLTGPLPVASAAAPLGPVARFRAGLGSLPATIRATEYLVVGKSPRFRAVQRRRTRTASRVGFVVIAASATFDALGLLDRSAEWGTVLLALNGTVAALAVIGSWALGGLLRRHPEPTAVAVTSLLLVATAATGIILPELAIETVAYLLLLPTLIALILPWSTVTHLRWLIGYAVVAFAYFSFGPSDRLTIGDRGELVIVGLIAIAASFVGHVLLQRAQIRNFSQLRRIQALHRRADADMAELARVHRALEETARTDPLTGAGNRVRLGEDLRAARARMNRLGQSHGLLALDLDRFKLINDRQGHLAGDEVLRATVRAIKATIRADDAVYRFGGEEFLVLLRLADRAGLEVAAERLRAAIEELGVTHAENPPLGVVTVSIGGTLVTPEHLGESDDVWFARADEALYRAKTSGRNRVEIN